MKRGRNSGRVARWFVILLTLICVGGGYWYWREAGRSEMMRAELERELAKAADASRAATAKALTEAEPERGKLAVLALSKELFAAALKTAEGLAFTEPKSQLRITLEQVIPDFGTAFPKVKAVLRGEWNGQTVVFDAEGVLTHELGEHGVKLEFVVLGVAPQVRLPSGLKSITSAQLASALNELIPPFDAPLPGAFNFAPEVKPIEDFWVPVPNGRVKLHLDVPPLPPLKVDWQPVAAFFDEAGLHILARVSTTGPLPKLAANTTSSIQVSPTDEELRAQIAQWPGLSAGQSYFAHVPSHALLSAIRSLPGPHTVKVNGSGQEGHIMEKTGGLPFGNGFKAGLAGPENLKVSGILDRIEPSWRAAEGEKPGGMIVNGHVAVNGGVKVHFHGNAPQITKRILGVKIVDVKVGGGAGKDIDATASAESPISAALTYRPNEQAFVLQIESPAEITAKVDIAGVPDDLERWLKLGFKVPIPAGKDLYRFKLPPVISEELKVTMPPGFTLAVKSVRLNAAAPTVELKADALEISGVVTLPDTAER